MAHTCKELIGKYRALNVAGRYIAVNVIVFAVLAFVTIFALLFNSAEVAARAVDFVELPANLELLLYRPWTLLSYMFVHLAPLHLLFNMLALYYFANIFLSLFSSRHFIGVYLLGGLIGALFYIAAYNFFPFFARVLPYARLVGASASVLAVVVAVAVRAPEARIQLLLFGSVRMKYFAIVMVLVSALMLGGSNAGGNFAHLGGAFAGWLFAFCMSKGIDVTAFINSAVNFFNKLFSGGLFKRGKKQKKGTFKPVGGSSRASDYEYNERRKKQSDEVDRILEKIKRGGYASLTDEEKRCLFEASDKK